MNITGVSHHTLAALPGTPGKAAVSLSISSPYIDLNNFSTSLEHKGLHTENNIKTKYSKIDHILENETINIYLNAKRIIWKKLTSTNLNAHIELNAGNWNLQTLSMNLGRGNIQLSTKIITQKSNKILSASYSLNKIRAEELLYSLDNFNLKGISHKNIRAELSMNGTLVSRLNNKGVINPSEIKANILFELKDGALLNYEPLLKIQEHVFKKRHLDSLKFATIKNSIEINNGNIHIPRMEVATSALNVFVGGDYALNGNTNLHIQVPLNNITRRDQTKKMSMASNKEKGGASVFLRAVSEENGQVKLKLDPNGGKYKREQLAQ
ncbi:MAG: AsmA-like C-terminal region-containing protein [Sediminibacterium sp.]